MNITQASYEHVSNFKTATLGYNDLQTGNPKYFSHIYLCIPFPKVPGLGSTDCFYGFHLFLQKSTDQKNILTIVLLMTHKSYGMSCLMTSSLLPVLHASD